MSFATTLRRPRETRTVYVMALLYLSYVHSGPDAALSFARLLNEQIMRRYELHGIPGLLELNERMAATGYL